MAHYLVQKKGVDLNLRCKDYKMTACHYAVEGVCNRGWKLLRFLLATGRVDPDERSDEMETLREFATKFNAVAAVRNSPKAQN